MLRRPEPGDAIATIVVAGFALGLLQVLAAAATWGCWLLGSCSIEPDGFYYTIRTAVMLAYAGAALALLVLGRTLANAAFAMTLLAVSCAFAWGIVRRTTGAWLDAPAVQTLMGLPVSAAAPFCAALFARELPARSIILDRIADTALCLGAGLGLVLLAANAPPLASAVADAVPGDLDHHSTTGDYWLVNMGFAACALIVAGFRLHFGPAGDRRLLRAFFGYIVTVALLVVAYTVITNTMDDTRHENWVWSPFGQGLVLPLLILLAGSIPVVASYVLLVAGLGGRPLRLESGRAYWAAIGVIWALALIPLGLLPWFLRGSRDLTLAEIASRNEGLVVLLLLLLCGAAFLASRWVAERVRSHYGRSPYDAFRIRSTLDREIRELADIAAIAERLRDAIGEAFGAQSRVYLATGRNHYACSSTGRALPDAALADALPAPALSAPAAALADAHVRLTSWPPTLAASLLAADGRVLGIIVVGVRRSELPFTEADTAFLDELAAVTAEAIELALGTIVYRPEHAVAHASECERCGLVFAPRTSRCERCGDELRPALLPWTLGERQLIRRLGTGASSTVYEGLEMLSRRRVALKTFSPAHPDQRARIIAEARIVAGVGIHPSIATLFDVITFEGAPVLVRELMEETLADRLARAPLIEPDVRRLGMELAAGLEFLHGQGVLHGDIKPDNIGFAADGHARLIDFGLARCARDSGGDGAWGTPAYRSPELVGGAPPDVRSDLWAFAVTLQEALTGVHPWLRSTTKETLMAIEATPFAPPGDALPGCSPVMAALLRDALAHDARERPESAGALLTRLRALPPLQAVTRRDLPGPA